MTLTRLPHLLLTTLLGLGLCLTVQAHPVTTLYLPGGLNTVFIDSPTDIRLHPNQTYSIVHITLGPQGQITQLPAGLATRSVFHLPDTPYSYAFNRATGRIEISRTGHTGPLLTLPVNASGETPIIVRGQESYQLRVDAQSLLISKHLASIPQAQAHKNTQPALWYLGSETQHLRLQGLADLRVQPNTHYTDSLHISLETPQTQIHHLSAALARNTQFTLPFGVSYHYHFDPAEARVDIRNAQGDTLLKLPVNPEGKTTWLRVGAEGQPKRLHAYYDDTLQRIVIAEDSHPEGRVNMWAGVAYPIQANSRLMSLDTTPAQIEIRHDLETDTRTVVLLSGQAQLYW